MNEIMKVAVIIPAYNEEQTIQDVVEAFSKELPKAHIVVVDNKSTDKTKNLAIKAIEKVVNSGVVLEEKKQGKGYAVRRAFLEVDADIYVMVDADMTYPADKVHDLILPIEKGLADMVVGDRHSLGDYESLNKRPFHVFGNDLVKKIVNRLFKSEVLDVMSGYRSFSRFFVENYPVMSKGFELETEMTIHAVYNDFSFVEIPVSYLDRPDGSVSKLNTYKDGLKVVATIINIFRYFKPFIFFSSISVMALLAGLIVGAPVVYEFIVHSYVYKVPSAILASSLMVISLLTFCVGLILDNMVRLHKFDYQLKLLRSRRS